MPVFFMHLGKLLKGRAVPMHDYMPSRAYRPHAIPSHSCSVDGILSLVSSSVWVRTDESWSAISRERRLWANWITMAGSTGWEREERIQTGCEICVHIPCDFYQLDQTDSTSNLCDGQASEISNKRAHTKSLIASLNASLPTKMSHIKVIGGRWVA